ncbi:MAG: hypothetical protein HKO66_09035 [Saprospiraceae bacterium]|nr:hypothetical protein [Bacteroidia bacterium]NNL92361.1 hypothetical protein [Saprospiraceae bacterium]
MMKYIALFLFFGLSNYTYAQDALEMKLFELPDVIFKKIDTPDGFESAYELKIKQPIDHNSPDKGHFYQRVFLSHRGYDNPTAIITNGYDRPSNNITEVATLLEANQINVEHRYFKESSPDSLDYDYLNFEQITADLHKINSLFKEIYSGKWISTGISKGGTTTIFYRYYYPDDVDVSIPYVAPVNLGRADQRIYDFLDNIGTVSCRKDIYNYQVRMLKKAEEIKPLLKWHAKGSNLKFNYLTFDEAYEYAILEYPFSFWQYGHDCNKIPNSEDDIDKHVQHFIDLVGLGFYADRAMTGYASHYYQSGTEMGYYGYETDDFKGLLKYLPTTEEPSAVFMPNKMERPFDGTLTTKVYEWTKTANNMIYINGALDTWSATAAPPSDDNNSLYYFLEGKHHATARIKNMTETERSELVNTLKKWLNSEPEHKP